jgi:hypothetical protein
MCRCGALTQPNCVEAGQPTTCTPHQSNPTRHVFIAFHLRSLAHRWNAIGRREVGGQLIRRFEVSSTRSLEASNATCAANACDAKQLEQVLRPRKLAQRNAD